MTFITRRTYIAAGLLCLCFTDSTRANDTIAVDSFREFIQYAVSQTQLSKSVYLNKRHNKWAKRRFEVSDIKYDVQRTNSLVSPLSGEVEFTLTTTQTQFADSKDAAETAETFDPTSRQQFGVRLVYSHDSNVWTLRTGHQESLKFRGKYEVSVESIRSEPDAIPNSALLYWLKSKQ